MTVLIFILVLFVLILVHELGHFLAAKASRMRVDEFGIGFPPRLISMVRGETRYSLNSLPFGGFVKIFGENGEEAVLHEGESRSFSSRPRVLQAVVLVAGVVMNVLLAWVLIYVVHVIGVEAPVAAENAGPDSELLIYEIVPESPAAEVGLTAGVRVRELSRDGEVLTKLTPEQFSSFIASDPDTPVTLTYAARKGELQTVTLTPKAGVFEDAPERAVIGVSPILVETKSYSYLEAIAQATKTTVRALGAITTGVATLIGDAFRLSADLSNVAGPVGIAVMVGDQASFGLSSLLMFTAVISLSLAVINMLPFPALDGGRLLIVAIEAVIRRPINPKWIAITNTVGFALLIALLIAITYNDILRII